MQLNPRCKDKVKLRWYLPNHLAVSGIKGKSLLQKDARAFFLTILKYVWLPVIIEMIFFFMNSQLEQLSVLYHSRFFTARRNELRWTLIHI